MTRLATLAILFCAFTAGAQTPTPAAENSEADQLLTLTKKIDEQSIKIDALSQQLLRLQQEIGEIKSAPSSTPASATTEGSPASTPTPSGPTHIVTKGETLTSIARMHKVSIGELQKINHIEDDRRLQIGQTLIIPGG